MRKFFSLLFLFIWIATLFLILINIYLADQIKPISNYINFNYLVIINITTGLLLIIIWLYPLLIKLKRLLIWILIIFVICSLVYLLLNYMANLQKTNGKTYSQNTGFNEFEKFYSDLLFEVFGYPPDIRMATSDEILTAVNNYRQKLGFSELIENDTLCQIAQARISELSSFSTSKKYEAVNTYQIDNILIKDVGEIVQSMPQPNLAPNIVEKNWARFFGPEKKLLNDASWEFGCSLVSDYKVVFVFGK